MFRYYLGLLFEVIIFLILLLCVSTIGNSSPITIALLDSGINSGNPEISKHLCKQGHKDFTNTNLEDSVGHGTFMALMIIRNIKTVDYCIINVKYHKSDSNNIDTYIRALRYLRNISPSIVNFSGGGDNFLSEEYEVIRGTKSLFIVAAGNKSRNIDTNPFYPASYNIKNLIVVGALDEKGALQVHSDYGKKVNYYELGENVLGYIHKGTPQYMSGTSVSTAIFTGKYVELTKGRHK